MQYEFLSDTRRITMYTKYHSKYYASELTLQRSSASIDGLTSSLSNARVDLNPHQIDAALFAFRSPLSNGVILADEVGLGKTVEAGIVIAQKWAERKRKILLILPSSLRKQWYQELDEKFFLKSIIMEKKIFNDLKKMGQVNPFEIKDKIVICSFNFASNMAEWVKRVNWDLIVIDEAHRLRNVYKPKNKIANNIKDATQTYPKLLLTATPLQNSLLELYGLVSMIDSHVFGDLKSFREQFVRSDSEINRNILLRQRLLPLCKRTLRKQVLEYVPFTNRISMIQEYYPTNEEAELYEKVSEYLQRDVLYALPASQRKLMTLVLRKLLASSSYAIAGTLKSLVQRLQAKLEEQECDIELDDFDTFDEIEEDWETGEEDTIIPENNRHLIESELQLLLDYSHRAEKIKINSKGENLLIALENGFKLGSELGASEKAVIFTESKRTQQYLYELLMQNGYENQIVLINGDNKDISSKNIYKEWMDRHKGEDTITGSKDSDMKAAVVEQFRDYAKILIATEAAAEGINLQFCSLVVNFDLPWNPQRVEQRIGRCHRYGQKNDVVVINFVNKKNEADVRVYELLKEKFKLFDGIFGASDEVIGILETGLDFEKKISDIYQNCRTKEEIIEAFDQMQQELDNEIKNKMDSTRQSLLENFDEEVQERLNFHKENTQLKLSEYEKWLLNLVKSELADEIQMNTSEPRFYYDGYSENQKYFHLDWKKAETNHDVFFRKDHPLAQKLILAATNRKLEVGFLNLDYTNYKGKISFFENLQVRSGWLRIDKLAVESFEKEEILILSAVTDAGEILDEELSRKLLDLSANEAIVGEQAIFPDSLLHQRKNEQVGQITHQIELKNLSYFDEEEEKLNAWADDLKHGLETDIKELDKEIKELRKESKLCNRLEDKLSIQQRMKTTERLRNDKRRRQYEEQDQIDIMRNELLENMEKQLKNKIHLDQLMTFRWKLV